MILLQTDGDLEAIRRREEKLRQQLSEQQEEVSRTQAELSSVKGSFEQSMASTQEGQMILKKKEIDDMVRDGLSVK